MPATAHTVLGPAATIAAELQIRQVFEDLTREHESARLVRLVGGKVKLLDMGEVRAQTINWPSIGEIDDVVTVTNAAGTGTTIVVSAAEGKTIRVGEQLQTMDDSFPEQLTVTANSGGSLTVVRATTGDSVRSLSVGDTLRRLAPAVASGADRLAEMTVLPTLYSANTQRIDQVCAVTDDLPEYDHYVIGDVRGFQRSEAMHEAMKGLNRALHFSFGGLLAAGTTAGGTYGRGILKGIAGFHREAALLGENNEFDCEGTPLWSDIARFLTTSRNHSDVEYWGFCSPEVHHELDMFGWNSHRANNNSEKEFGFSFDTYKGGGFKVNILEDDCMRVAPHSRSLVLVPKGQMQLLVGSEGLFKLYEGVTGPAKDGSHVIRDLFTALVVLRIKDPRRVRRIIGF